MGTMRTHWKSAKQAMEDEPKMGKEWIAKTFRDDLGPKVDQLEALYDEEIGLTRQIIKLIESLNVVAVKSEKLHGDIRDKTTAYRKSIDAKVNQDKIKGSFTGPLSLIDSTGVTITRDMKKTITNALAELQRAHHARTFAG